MISNCPPIPEYDEEFQTALADELNLMHDDAASLVAIIDYGRLRAQLRECQ